MMMVGWILRSSMQPHGHGGSSQYLIVTVRGEETLRFLKTGTGETDFGIISVQLELRLWCLLATLPTCTWDVDPMLG